MVEVQNKIRRLLKEKNAILLAHNYQRPEIQDVADLCGDSLELSLKAAGTDADVILFCGVHFMAETASIACPDKTVLLPVSNAGCPMADDITPETLLAKKAELPGVPVVTYVNSPASVKALSDMCCTSANAIEVAKSLDSKRILMTPDRNLAMYVAQRTDKEIILWDGCCPVHDEMTRQDVLAQKEAHPEAVFIAHPECRPEVLDLADRICSTSGMLSYVRQSDAEAFIVGTEEGLLYPMRRDNPHKRFYLAWEGLVCQDMKRTRIADVLRSLENMEHVIKVPETIRIPAFKAVRRMLDLRKPARS
ncbi:MAG: quinolinate synthase NadA [Desulfobacteria bacterium]